MLTEIFAQLKRHAFIALLAVLIITFFTRNNCRSVKDIHPAVLKTPSQIKIAYPATIAFANNNYSFQVTPIYYYDLNGIIVGKMDYRLFSIYKTDSVFPMDLCMIWGDNVKSAVYRNPSVKFSQDCRWCWVHWLGDVKFNLNEISNNHLLVNNKRVEGILKTLVVGDQVRIKGKLVNVKARLTGRGSSYDSSEITWNSSTTREDGGAGACEVIYVDEIEVLRKANILSYYLFHASLYGIIALTIWKAIRFFYTPRP
ncbi:MAG: hypothetical protein ACM3IL_01660 [Deltaproteobacteria bacterium]